MDDYSKLGCGCWIVILIVGFFVYFIGSSQKEESTNSTTSDTPIVTPYTQPSNNPSYLHSTNTTIRTDCNKR